MIEKSELRYHHIGIPSTEKRADEIYFPKQKLSCVPGINNAYGVQWTRFDEDAPYPGIVKEHAHVAFEVDSLEQALEGEQVIVEPDEVMPGVRAAFINVLEAPVKLMEIDPAKAAFEAKNPVANSGKALKYHHTGMPCNKIFANEIRVHHLKLAYLPGQYNNYGVEWMRFDADNENPDIIKYIPHVAFEVPDIDQAVVGEKVLYHSGRSTPGIIVVMIEVDGVSVEFIELDRSIVGNQYDA